MGPGQAACIQPQWFHTQNPSAVSSDGNYHLHIQPELTGQGVLLELPCQRSVQVKLLPKVAGVQWVRVWDQPSSHRADHILNDFLCSHRVRVVPSPISAFPAAILSPSHPRAVNAGGEGSAGRGTSSTCSPALLQMQLNPAQAKPNSS